MQQDVYINKICLREGGEIFVYCRITGESPSRNKHG
jgi:hypothetical protein